ncbi:MAG TPA: hypothetical protein VHE35_01570 [Kofleriaceae bacterium]|nr:hypothetical protein [Kofleriaceae bacterium]
MKQGSAGRALLVGLLLVPACGAAVRPVMTSPEQKIWLVKGQDAIYRCADAGGVDEAPKPVCVRATVVDRPAE